MTIKRRLILDQLQTQLEGINGTGSYSTTVANVFRHAMTWNEVEQPARPALCIVPRESVPTYHPCSEVKVTFHIDILGYVDGDVSGYDLDDTTAEDARINALNDLIDDIWIALRSDPTLGGNAITVNVIEERTDEADELGQEAVRVSLAVVYFRTLGASA